MSASRRVSGTSSMPTKASRRWNSACFSLRSNRLSVWRLMYVSAAIKKPAVPAAGSWTSSPGCGFITSTIASISGRGVKYWPAPLLVSLAFFSSRPS